MSVTVTVRCDHHDCRRHFRTRLYEAHNEWRDYNHFEFDVPDGWYIDVDLEDDPGGGFARCPDHRGII